MIFFPFYISFDILATLTKDNWNQDNSDNIWDNLTLTTIYILFVKFLIMNVVKILITWR